MKREQVHGFLFFLCLSAILSGCSFGNAQTSWVYSFVVWDGYVYQITDEYVQEVDEEIGEVTYYSDQEGSYSGNFSNKYEKGAKYYSITGVSTEEAIAIEEDGKYRKGIRDGEYIGR